MDTNDTRTNSTTAGPDLDAANERIRQANERILAAGRTATVAYLDGVERYVAGFVQAERKAGEQSQIELFGQLLKAHASFTEDVVKAGVTVTRELVSA
jgi:hypothetical protein